MMIKSPAVTNNDIRVLTIDGSHTGASPNVFLVFMAKTYQLHSAWLEIRHAAGFNRSRSIVIYSHEANLINFGARHDLLPVK